tara:strand:+ start:1013 stop:1387 length:375 start_codon:yes stop_codon:yes gene_type:complete
MFNTKKKIAKLETIKSNLELEVEKLKEDASKAKEELAEVKHKKKMEDEDIKHMVKMSTERGEIELKQKIMDVNKQKDDAVAAVKDEYRDKMETRLQSEVDNIKEMYGQILERLPNVTARFKGDI